MAGLLRSMCLHIPTLATQPWLCHHLPEADFDSNRNLNQQNNLPRIGPSIHPNMPVEYNGSASAEPRTSGMVLQRVEDLAFLPFPPSAVE